MSTVDVECPSCGRADTLEVNPRHGNTVGYHCAKCQKYSTHMVKTADARADRINQKNRHDREVWKKIPAGAYVTARQVTRGANWIFVLNPGDGDDPLEFMSRDSLEFQLTKRYMMSWAQTNAAINGAMLTPGQKIYFRHLTKISTTVETETGPLYKTGDRVDISGRDAIFLRFGANGFAHVTVPGVGDTEIHISALTDDVVEKLRTLRELIDDPAVDPDTKQRAQREFLRLKKGAEAHGVELDKTAYWYKAHWELEMLQMEDREVDGTTPPAKDSKPATSDTFPHAGKEYQEPGRARDVDKKAASVAVTHVKGEYGNSGDLKAALSKHYRDLSIADIRRVIGFYRATGKIGRDEADRLTKWFIGDSPRLLAAVREAAKHPADCDCGFCAKMKEKKAPSEKEAGKTPAVCNFGTCTKKAAGDSDFCAEHEGKEKKGAELTAQCTCEGVYDPYCPEHGAREQRRPAKEEKPPVVMMLGAKQASTAHEAESVAVQCLECDKKFKTRSLTPTCPGCGGSDVDLAYHPMVYKRRGPGADKAAGPEKLGNPGSTRQTVGDPPAAQAHGGVTAIHLKAPQDANGNPRRVFMVYDGGDLIGAVDEGYSGVGALKMAGFPDAKVVSEFNITPREYQRIIREHSVERTSCDIEPPPPGKEASDDQRAELCKECGASYMTWANNPSPYCPKCRSKPGKKKSGMTLSGSHMKHRALLERGLGIFYLAMHKGKEVIIIAIDNTGDHATVQYGNKQYLAPVEELTPTDKAGIKRAMSKRAAGDMPANLPRDEKGRFPSYVEPGGYPIIYVTGDGEVLCPECANGENGSEASPDNDDPSWRIVGYDTFFEGPPEHCAHCNKEIESAYGDPEEDKHECGPQCDHASHGQETEGAEQPVEEAGKVPDEFRPEKCTTCGETYTSFACPTCNTTRTEREPKQAKGVPVNPWAICHTTVDKKKDPEKYERCVQDVKKEHPIKESAEGAEAAVSHEPGKFEGELSWAPAIWDMVLNGMADDEFFDDDRPVAVFSINDELIADLEKTGTDDDDLKELRESIGDFIIVYEDDQGFVTADIFDSAELESARGEAESGSGEEGE